MILRALAERAREQRTFDGPWGEDYRDGRIPAPGADSGTFAGVTVNDRQAMRLTAVFSCVSLIAESMGQLPVVGIRREKDRRRRVDVQLLDDPHPESDWPDWIARYASSALLRGNSYGYVDDIDREGVPTSVLPLDPREVQVRRADRTKRGQIVYRTGGGKELAWPRGPIWHTRGLTLAGDIKGCSPIEYARQSIALNLAAEEFGARFFGDGANPSGFLSTEQKITDQNVAKRILGDFVKAIGGTGRRRKAVMLTHGVKWEQLSVPPNEAQFLETRDFGVTEVARLYRVPPWMIGAVDKTTSWGSGIEQQAIAFVTHTLGPWLTRYQYSLGRLLRPIGVEVKFNTKGFLRGDFKARMDGYAIGRQWGIYTVNDIRELEDEDPVEGGDVRLEPLNMVPMGKEITRDTRERLTARLDQIRRELEVP